MLTITRKLTFEASHRVYGHESKCANVHGHSYKVFITAKAETALIAAEDLVALPEDEREDKLDDIGRIIDFSVLKTKFGDWLDTHWDHAHLWFKDDPAGQVLYGAQGIRMFQEMKNFQCAFNPTAENIAKFLLHRLAPDLMRGTGVVVTKIELHETENCKAVATLR